MLGKDNDAEIGEKKLKINRTAKEFKHFDTKIFISALEESYNDKNGKIDFKKVLRCISARFENETQV